MFYAKVTHIYIYRKLVKQLLVKCSSRFLIHAFYETNWLIALINPAPIINHDPLFLSVFSISLIEFIFSHIFLIKPIFFTLSHFSICYDIFNLHVRIRVWLEKNYTRIIWLYVFYVYYKILFALWTRKISCIMQ